MKVALALEAVIYSPEIATFKQHRLVKALSEAYVEKYFEDAMSDIFNNEVYNPGPSSSYCTALSLITVSLLFFLDSG